MRNKLGVILTALAVVLMTGTFGYAQAIAGEIGNFPYFHIGLLMVGGLILISLKRKYEKMYISEAVGVFAMYTILISLFTVPVIDMIKTIVT